MHTMRYFIFFKCFYDVSQPCPYTPGQRLAPPRCIDLYKMYRCRTKALNTAAGRVWFYWMRLLLLLLLHTLTFLYKSHCSVYEFRAPDPRQSATPSLSVAVFSLPSPLHIIIIMYTYTSTRLGPRVLTRFRGTHDYNNNNIICNCCVREKHTRESRDNIILWTRFCVRTWATYIPFVLRAYIHNMHRNVGRHRSLYSICSGYQKWKHRFPCIS